MHDEPLDLCVGAVLAADALALTDLPVSDVSAMDGWAVAGPGPWIVVGHVLAGTAPAPLARSCAVSIATGAAVPAGADGILRREWGWVDGRRLTVADTAPEAVRAGGVPPGHDLRRVGEESAAGDVVLVAGTVLDPVRAALLAAAGHDTVSVRRATAEILVLGDELLERGPARLGRPRDALGPLLAQWLPMLGVHVVARHRVADRDGDLMDALTASRADLVVTTGSTARGPVDHLHAVLDRLAARWVVDGVAVRPGHPQLMALVDPSLVVIGLPGNPLAAVTALLTLVAPTVRAMHGLPFPEADKVVLTEAVTAGRDATRLVPIADGLPVTFAGPGMLRGLACADCVAVVPPGGAAAGEAVEALPARPRA